MEFRFQVKDVKTGKVYQAIGYRREIKDKSWDGTTTTLGPVDASLASGEHLNPGPEKNQLRGLDYGHLYEIIPSPETEQHFRI